MHIKEQIQKVFLILLKSSKILMMTWRGIAQESKMSTE